MPLLTLCYFRGAELALREIANQYGSSLIERVAPLWTQATLQLEVLPESPPFSTDPELMQVKKTLLFSLCKLMANYGLQRT